MTASHKKILITGGAGFIGSHLVRLWLAKDPSVHIVNFDKLTYCGDLSRLKDVESNPRYRFIQGDVCDPAAVEKALEGCTGVVHAAAETHVDRSLIAAKDFLDSNIYGTYVLLEAARKAKTPKFLTVSTDEVYGSREKGFFTEKDPMHPTSPYSVSKAAADMLTLAYAHTHGMHTVVTRGSNTFGPYQYLEKVIPLFVTNALSGQSLPLYGDGKQIRNWMYVEDHCTGIMKAFEKGKAGQAYNIATPFYETNIVLTRSILKILRKPESLISPVTDRLGHDRRYAIDPKRLRALGWRPRHPFARSLKSTVLWYRDHSEWWKKIREKSADFKSYYAKAYQGRAS